MNTVRIESMYRLVMIGVVAFGLVACNTTKATFDTTAKFFSSTSPDSMFNQDGLVEENHKLTLYTSIVYDNLQQDIARGTGEYLSSLGVLLDVPEGRRDEWRQLAQTRYSALFPDGAQPSEEVVGRLSRELVGKR